jgi:DNA-binding transcriptional LysR family regulator
MPRKPTEKNQESAEVASSFGNIANIRRIHETYRRILESPSSSMAQIAREFGIQPPRLQKLLNEFESTIRRASQNETFSLLDRGPGKPARANTADETVQLMEEVAELVHAYDTVMKRRLRPLTIRIGSSLTVSNFLLPQLLKDPSFDNPSVNFEFIPSKPRNLELRRESGECDIIVVPMLPQTPPADIVGQVRLQMALLARRGHAIERLERHFEWSDLSVERDRMILLKEEPSRYPMPEYPTKEFHPHLRRHYVSSTSLAHLLVMDGHGLTISLPQFFSSRQREFFHIVSHRSLSTIPLAVLRSAQRRNVGARRAEVLSQVENRILAALQALEGLPTATQSSKMTMYHVSCFGELQWVRGPLVWRLDDDRFVSGNYEVRPPSGGEPTRFVLTGRIGAVDTDDRRRVICNAVSEDDGDVFAVHGSCSAANGFHREFVGVWIGQLTYETDRRPRAFDSYVVISDRDDLRPPELNDIVRQYYTDDRRELPETAAY